jgi:hypothetical protein
MLLFCFILQDWGLNPEPQTSLHFYLFIQLVVPEFEFRVPCLPPAQITLVLKRKFSRTANIQSRREKSTLDGSSYDRFL